MTLKKIGVFCAVLVYTITYVMITAVVIMLLFSALHIISPDLFKFEEFDLTAGVIIAVIVVLSVRVFFKTLKRVHSFISQYTVL